MNATDEHLEWLAKHVQHSCNKALLDYLLGFPERRVQSISFSNFATPARLRSFERLREISESKNREGITKAQKLKILRQGGKDSTQTLDFVVFIGGDKRTHRQYLPLRKRSRGIPEFPCDDPQLEFYKYFDGLSEDMPGDNGFIRWKETMTLGEYGRFGKTMMKTPPPDLQTSKVVYRARNGDCAFSRNGSFFWFGWRRGAVKEISGDFAGLITAYVKSRSKGDALPFDSYNRKHTKEGRANERFFSAVEASRADDEFKAQHPN